MSDDNTIISYIMLQAISFILWLKILRSDKIRIVMITRDIPWEEIHDKFVCLFYSSFVGWVSASITDC